MKNAIWMKRKAGEKEMISRRNEKAIKCVNLMLDSSRDGEMVRHLEQQADVHEYLKDLIRRDMEASVPNAETGKAEGDFNATLELMKRVVSA